MGGIMTGLELREAFQKSLKDMLRTITDAEPGDVGPIREVMGKCEDHLLLSLLKVIRLLKVATLSHLLSLLEKPVSSPPHPKFSSSLYIIVVSIHGQLLYLLFCNPV